MQNNKESGGLHRHEPNRDSCRPDDVTISKNASVQRIEECARIAGPHAEPLTGVAVNRRDMRRSTRRQFETMIRVYGNKLKGNAFYEVARTVDVSVPGRRCPCSEYRLACGRGGVPYSACRVLASRSGPPQDICHCNCSCTLVPCCSACRTRIKTLAQFFKPIAIDLLPGVVAS